MIFCFCFMFSHLLLLHYFLLITVIHTLFSVTHPAVFCMMYFLLQCSYHILLVKNWILVSRYISVIILSWWFWCSTRCGTSVTVSWIWHVFGNRSLQNIKPSLLCSKLLLWLIDPVMDCLTFLVSAYLRNGRWTIYSGRDICEASSSDSDCKMMMRMIKSNKKTLMLIWALNHNGS
jgi:hypothetical protein